MAAVHDLKLTDNALPHLSLCFDVDDLHIVRNRAGGRDLGGDGCKQTLRAMTVFVGMCLTLLTVPPFPAPKSLMNSRSSGLRSKLNSMPISSWAALSSSFCPCIPPKLAFSAVGGGFGAAGVRARPLTFLRFIERGAKPASAMVREALGFHTNDRLDTQDLVLLHAPYRARRSAFVEDQKQRRAIWDSRAKRSGIVSGGGRMGRESPKGCCLAGSFASVDREVGRVKPEGTVTCEKTIGDGGASQTQQKRWIR